MADQHHGRGEPSLIAGITQQIMRQYHVDVNRVYVAGLSSGGAMAAIMATTYPELSVPPSVCIPALHMVLHEISSAFAAMKQGPSQHSRLPTQASR